ncbi:PH domain-containing protein [Campylobacter jejuni]|uniref:PH domain-containing protein n=1 Tax=Campylobacter jejuni TaxID=197 RepID=UPI002740A95D|nr:PH domain-containing protein [Campylobacter jejuni]
MPSLEEIQSQISDFSNAKNIFSRKEIKALPDILWENEKVKKAAQGTYNLAAGLLVATDKRLIFIDKGIFSLKVETFLYDKISSIEYSTGLMFGEIVIYASGNKAKIKNMEKNETKEMAEFVRECTQNTDANNHISTTNSDLTVELERISNLKDKGIITEEEFKTMKEKIIAKM